MTSPYLVCQGLLTVILMKKGLYHSIEASPMFFYLQHFRWHKGNKKRVSGTFQSTKYPCGLMIYAPKDEGALRLLALQTP